MDILGHVHNWSDLERLLDPSEWPATKKARKKLYSRLRRFHGTKSTTGSLDRQTAIEHVYKLAEDKIAEEDRIAARVYHDEL